MSAETTGTSQTEGTKRTVPMQVLCVGLCRTGTQSLADALQELGIGPIYHMRELQINGHHDPWTRALEAKLQGKGEKFGREQFDELLGGYAGIADIPGAFFVDDLIAAYPEAVIINGTRTEDSWIASMNNTLWAAQKTRIAAAADPNGPPANPKMRFAACYWDLVWENDFEKTGRPSWRRHKDHLAVMRSQVEKRGGKWMDFSLGMGFEELCEFLGKEVPKDAEGRVKAFPHHDDWAAWQKAEARRKKEKEEKEREERETETK